MTKLKYFLEKGKKIYTLKEETNNKPTKDAHYKFVKLRGEKEIHPKFERR